jgi:hypothetical protein
MTRNQALIPDLDGLDGTTFYEKHSPTDDG